MFELCLHLHQPPLGKRESRAVRAVRTAAATATAAAAAAAVAAAVAAAQPAVTPTLAAALDPTALVPP